MSTTRIQSGHTLQYKEHTPQLASDVYIAPTAAVIGDVRLEERCSVWFGAVLRGDEVPIRIGAGTNIQDNCVIHGNPGDPPVEIGADVTVGHGAIIHGGVIGDHCLIGMGSVILDGAQVGASTMIAAGAVLSPGKKTGSGELWAGCPARKIRDLTPAELDGIRQNSAHYIQQAAHYQSDRVAYIHNPQA